MLVLLRWWFSKSLAVMSPKTKYLLFNLCRKVQILLYYKFYKHVHTLIETKLSKRIYWGQLIN